MPWYTLSYDVEDSNSEKSTEILYQLVELLIVNNAIKIGKPTQSTLLFNCSENDLNNINKSILSEENIDIYFIISEFQDNYFILPDEELNTSFINVLIHFSQIYNYEINELFLSNISDPINDIESIFDDEEM